MSETICSNTCCPQKLSIIRTCPETTRFGSLRNWTRQPQPCLVCRQACLALVAKHVQLQTSAIYWFVFLIVLRFRGRLIYQMFELSGPPMPNKDNPTPYPYILISLTPQGGRRPLVLSIALQYMGMVLDCPVWPWRPN